MSSQTFGERLAWLRKVGGVGSRELGQLAGLSDSYCSVVEPSAWKPGFATVASIAEVFGVSMRWLGVGDGPLPDPAEVTASVQRARERKSEAT